MIVEPKSYRCTILIEEIRADSNTPDKYLLSGKILATEDRAKENIFFAQGRAIKGFTFTSSSDIKPGVKVTADVEFMGNPRIQNYQLSAIEIVQ